MSPYFEVGNISPAGAPVAGLLAQRNNLNQDAVNSIARFAGQLAGGVTGAVQGATTPSTFGADTSTGMAALKGFEQNVAPDANGGMNVKQLQQAGKAADSFRNMIKLGMPQVEGADQTPALGIDDDKWSTMSALDKYNVVGSAVKAQATNAVMANILQRISAVGRNQSATTLNNARAAAVTAQAPVDTALKVSETNKNNAETSVATATAAATPDLRAAQIAEANARVKQLNAQAAKDSAGKPLYTIISHVSTDANGKQVVTPVVNATTAEGWQAGTKALKNMQAQDNAVAWPGVKQAVANNWYQTDKGLLYYDGKKLTTAAPE